MVDVTVRHNFIGDAHDVLRHGTLRNPDRPDLLLDQAAADKIRNYREPYARNRSLAFLPAADTQTRAAASAMSARPELRGIKRSHAKKGREDGVCALRVFCASKLPSFLARWRVRGPVSGR